MTRAASQPDPLTSLLRLYRDAQRLQAQDFSAYVFDWLGAHLSFEKCVIITTFVRCAGWVDAQFFGIEDPHALMASHEKVRHLDSFITRIFAKPMTALRLYGGAPEISGRRFVPLREHLRIFGGWHEVAIVVPSAQHHTSTVMILCRDEHASEFSDDDVTLVEQLAPHVVEAAAVNRAAWLPHTATGTAPVALLDREGRFVQTSASFLRLFWPNKPPATAYLAAEILQSLRHRKPWSLPGGTHCLHGEPDENGSWHLRITAKSPLDQLTPREREVATLFAHGESHKAIATRLGLAPMTVRNHLQNLYGKLDVARRDELLALVSKH